MWLLDRLGLKRGREMHTEEVKNIQGTFHCPHRHTTDINVKAIKFLCELEKECGFRIYVNSGCRCPECNKNAGGSEKSAHVKENFKDNKSCAFDIRVIGGWQRWKVVNAAIKLGCKRIGISYSFIHTDLGDWEDNYPLPVIWVY